MEIYPQKHDHLVYFILVINRIPEKKNYNFVGDQINRRTPGGFKVILLALRLLFTQDCDDLSPERDYSPLISIVFWLIN